MVSRLEEKRRFPRIKLKMPLRYQVRGTPEFHNSIINDISLGGINFTNNKFIAPLTNLMLEINILSRVLSPVGRIAWVSSLSHSDSYRLGVEFLELNANDKNYLADYINMQRGNL